MSDQDSDVEFISTDGDFFQDLDAPLTAPSWDTSDPNDSPFSQPDVVSAGKSKGSSKTLVSHMIKDAISERSKKRKRTEPTESDDEGEEGGLSSKSVRQDASDTDSDPEEDEVRRKKKDKFFEQPPPQMEATSFADMHLSRPLLRAVGSLGFTNPTPIQASTIPVALCGKDICACSATGTGKTAAFLLPIMERLLFRPNPKQAMTRVLVLVPTRELALQVHAVASSIGKLTSITVCLAAGGLDIRQQEAALRQLPDIVIATPGRLVDHIHNTPSFTLSGIEILVLDEADRMLQEHFEEQLHEIVKACYRGRQTMLFSATMTDEVEDLASLSLNQPVRLFMNSNTQVATKLQQEFVRIRSHREDSRSAIVVALCCKSFTDRVIIFMPTKVKAHRLRIQLGLLGLNVEELHGDLTQLQRLEALDNFKKGEVDYLVATDLAARGLDVAGVKTVINFSMPSTVKQYVHRVGRTARAGRGGRSVSLIGEKERKMLKQIVKQSSQVIKVRVVGPKTIEKYSKKLSDMDGEVKSMLKRETEEKEVRKAEMEVGKAKNMIEHREEIYSRPKRTFIKKSGGSKHGKKQKQK